MRKIKENKAITLVALVITVIILLILAGISIAQLTGNGLFKKAKVAKEVSNNAQEDEIDKIAKYGNEINNYIDGHRETITLTTEQYKALTDRIIILENNNNYSTSEKIVGTWTDGKPIYQITIENLNVKMSWVGTHAYTSCTITAPVANVKKIINARASMSSSNNGFENWSQIANVNIGSANSTTWTIACLEDYYLKGLTVQYTKTTD